jgi:hypothetical protein
MAERGSKGAWRVKGKVRDELFEIFEEDASSLPQGYPMRCPRGQE